jgi:hypothetical protein
VRSARRWAALLLVAMVFSACAAGDDDSEVATPPLDTQTTAAQGPTTAPPCSAARHAVILDFGGTLTVADEATVMVEALEVAARPGSADVANAYRDRGYEILYLLVAPPDTPVGGTTLLDAFTVWLSSNGFPMGDGTRIWTWEEGEDPLVALIEELLRLEQANVTIDAAYTDDPDKAHALTSGGVPPDKLWTLGEAAGIAGTTGVSDDDLAGHLGEVETLGMICRPD